MSFPTVQARNHGAVETVQSTHTLNLPSGIQPGDLLIAVLHYGVTGATITWPGGWTAITGGAVEATTGGAQGIASAYRKADGTEGASISVTSGINERICYQTYRISNAADPAVQAPEAASTANAASASVPDPPSLTPTGGAKDYLWLAAGGRSRATADTSNDITAGPTNYSSQQIDTNTTLGANFNSSGTFERSLNAASENPGAFTTNGGSTVATGLTIAIHPSGSPVDAGQATSGGTNTNSASVSIPSGIVAGDIVVVHFTVNNGDPTGGIPSGWTQLDDQVSLNAPPIESVVYYRNCDGGEGTTITQTWTGGSAKWAATAWRITGGDTTTAPVISTVAKGNGTTTPDPSSLTPAGGSKAYLWIWIGGSTNQPTMPPTSQPSGYQNRVGVQSGGSGSAGSKCTAFGATKQATASSEDPGSWTISTASDTLAWVVAVYPATVVLSYYTVINGSDAQLVNVNSGGVNVDALTYKNGVGLTNAELATLLDGSTFGRKDVAVMANLAGDAAQNAKKKILEDAGDYLST